MTAGLKAWYKNLPDSHPSKAHKHYNRIDKRGVFFAADISWPGGGGPKYEVLHPTTKKPVTVPARGWITPDPKKMQGWINDDRVEFGNDEKTVPTLKKHLRDGEYQPPYSVFYQDGRAATKRLRALMGEDVFDFPKDETVLQELIEMMTGDEDVIMDFFAGSGTTAQSVLAQNALDNSRRRYVLVQLPEPLDPANKGQSAAAAFCENLGKPLNIAELTKERLRRASSLVKAGKPEFAGDLGFRVYKLATSNIVAWEPEPTDLEGTLFANAEHLVPGRSEQDVLYELLLKLGLDLCVPIDTKDVAGKAVHSIGGGALIVCLADGLTTETVEAVASGIVAWWKELAPAVDTRVVFKDSGFADDVVKSNMAAILNQNGIPDVRSL